jgi:hypothetical protein
LTIETSSAGSDADVVWQHNAVLGKCKFYMGCVVNAVVDYVENLAMQIGIELHALCILAIDLRGHRDLAILEVFGLNPQA